MNQIVRGILQTFVDDFRLQKLKEDTAFEYFINYIVGNQFSFDRITADDLDQVNVGGGTNKTNDGEDGSIDGILIFVDDVLVTTIETLDDLIQGKRQIDVDFIFTQAKRSESFNKGELNNFLEGIEFFFQEHPIDAFNTRLKELHEIKNKIFTYAASFNNNPSCYIYFATTGTWEKPDPLVRSYQKTVKELEKKSIFHKVEFFPYDRKDIQTKWRESQFAHECTIEFPKHQIMPKTDKVNQAFIGVISCKEFLHLITNDDDTLIRDVFYDNVRDYQGDNPVNTSIKDTLISKNDQKYFALLNNGMTVMAKEIKQTGDSFKLTSYQIVNGCQTSHVLFHNIKHINTDAFIPLKLIESNDDRISEMIIRATNSQTEVKEEAFEALSEFHKDLESYYESYPHENKLYYERRSKQHKNNETIKSYTIVTLASQTKNFVGMFLDEPQSTHRYYGELIRSYSSKIFIKAHHLGPYFVSSLTSFRIEEYFLSHHELRKYKQYKFHLMMLFKIIVCKEMKKEGIACSLQGKKAEKMSEKFLIILNDKMLVNKVFTEAISILEEEIKTYAQNSPSKKKDFTKNLQLAI